MMFHDVSQLFRDFIAWFPSNLHQGSPCPTWPRTSSKPRMWDPCDPCDPCGTWKLRSLAGERDAFWKEVVSRGEKGGGWEKGRIDDLCLLEKPSFWRSMQSQSSCISSLPFVWAVWHYLSPSQCKKKTSEKDLKHREGRWGGSRDKLHGWPLPLPCNEISRTSYTNHTIHT